mmetsp:Transcript_61328/g.146207  ORF Transcript_61328/g.146207 Transcript_61328/m.146207 type:complete len:210 (+) Transcript_61328:319-948(+)
MAAAGGVLQQGVLLLRSHGLHGAPEGLPDLRGGARRSAAARLPLLDIQLIDAAKQETQLSGRQHALQALLHFRRDQSCHAPLQCGHLRLHGIQQAMMAQQIQVLHLVLLRDWALRAPHAQLQLLSGLCLVDEVQAQVCELLWLLFLLVLALKQIEHSLLVELGVHRGNILRPQRGLQQAPAQGPREAHGDLVLVQQRQADQLATKLQLG